MIYRDFYLGITKRDNLLIIFIFNSIPGIIQ